MLKHVDYSFSNDLEPINTPDEYLVQIVVAESSVFYTGGELLSDATDYIPATLTK